MTHIPTPQLLVTHVVIVRFTDIDSNLDRRVAYYAYGEDNARCLAVSLSGTVAAVSDTIPFVGATKQYPVRAVEWAAL